MHERQSTRVDLHMHSTASDGLKTPTELCRMAVRLGLDAIALCDHDTLAGLSELREAARQISSADGGSRFTAIGGIELSAGSGGHVHLLGYAPREDDPALNAQLAFAAKDRRERTERMLELLARQGVDLSDERERLLSNRLVGRAHIARAIVSRGCASTAAQAFERYLEEGRPAYIPRKTLALKDAIALLKGAGATVSLAHPMRLKLDNTALAALIAELRVNGLDAIEAYHPTATRGKASALERMARRMGLMVTGGSDYHGDGGVRSRMGRLPERWASAASDLDALIHAITRK